ncbi:Na+/H+ antiporter NhaA [Intestinibacter bartlettii]|uniref:Na(+)/H(+) antiporter NhaA n=2 Tax=Intestinibacter bartlettii TaxID=261299 RepID=A0ABS6DV60_9FIRM|nr:Na+/H+ antiporter NhaA [Intestinibacter bartlettii]MBU5335694.1 Na+/H+ antiporter NhaA [Intestinibacter bartlettii]
MKNFERYKRSMKSEALSSILLLVCTISALSIANSSFEGLYNRIIFDNHFFKFPLNEFINDFLMFFFFLNVGLEIKENILFGNLSSIKKASFPVIGSIGGVIVPAIIFLLFNHSTDYINGFCIPISTDIAFAVGIFYIFKNHINPQARLFLLTLAVVDDLISILVIAIFFTQNINTTYLFIAILVMIMLIIANKIFHIENIPYYIFGGLVLWYLINCSNVHPTISGILLAICIPATPYKNKKSVLEILQENLSPFTNFIVIPLFAFVNSGVSLDITTNLQSSERLYYGILLGLSVGKPLGITLFTYVFSKLKLVSKPKGLDFYSVFLVSLIAGIGFTMSIFMCELTFSYDFELVNLCKFAILSACLCSVILTSAFIFVNEFFKSKKHSFRFAQK